LLFKKREADYAKGINSPLSKVKLMFIRIGLLMSVILAAANLHAQQMFPQQNPQRRGRQAFMPQVELIKVTGTLKNKMPGILIVTTDTQGDLMIGVNMKTKVTYTAEGKPEILRPGMCIAFKATVDSKGTAVDKIGDLSVFTVSQEKILGLFPEGSPAEPVEAEKSKKPEKPKKADKKNQEPQLYEVRGKLVNYNPRDRSLQVNTGRGTVRGTLGEDVKVSIELSDISFFSFLAAGDKVTAEVLPKNSRQGLAQILTVAAAQPLGEGDKPSALKPVDRRKPNRDDKPKKDAPAKGLPATGENK
jgi:hypothetical protein